MTTNSIDEAFADFEERYPGSRQTRRPAVELTPTPQPTDVTWDGRSYTKIINGKPVELFAIGALSAALGRPLVTIRLWTNHGKLPQATYRLPTRQVNIYAADGSVSGHKEQKGRRLYSRPQIEAVLRIATEHGILHARRIDWTQHLDFGLEVADAWQKLNAA